jgi:hypothetical protein
VKKIQEVPAKYYSQVQQKSKKLEKQVDKRTKKALDRFAREEKRMQSKLAKMDSLAASNIFTHSIDSLGKLKSRLKQKTGKYEQALSGNYSAIWIPCKTRWGFLKIPKSC